MINIAIADDHSIVTEGFVELLKRDRNIHVQFTASDGKMLLDELKTKTPSIILLDLDMPIISGKEAFEKIKKRYSKIKIIIITASYSPTIILSYVKKGASSFLVKNCSLNDLLFTINKVHKDGKYFDSNVSQILADEIENPVAEEKQVQFSEIELNVLKHMCAGLSSKEIAEKLFIDRRTVEWHQAQMMRKINAKSSNVLCVYAAQHKLI